MLRTVTTENGVVKGLPAADPRITSFKGIPFAAPPVGENRWRAPQPCENWEGVLEAYEYAPISVQDTPAVGDDIYCREWHVDKDIPMSEDCLYLNVWTGAKSPDEKLPVLIWYFGGALQWGYTAEMEFDGERIARRGIVVVSVNYRLNLFGFMAHPELTAAQPEAPTNFGNLDQQAGLNWVIRNIAAFGGDPENITIAGQSAGGGSVMSQMTCPDNFGRFQKAVVMSGIIRDPYVEGGFTTAQKLEVAEQKGVDFLKFIGVNSIEEARKLDAIYLRDQYAEFAKENPRMTSCIDGKFNPGDPVKQFLADKHAHVPVMAGNTADEFPNTIAADSKEEFISCVKEIFGDKAEEFLKLEEATKQDANGKYGAVSGIECTVKALFERNRDNGNDQNCYYYRFTPDIPGWDNPGTFHSVDLWFFFETLAKCWRPFVGRHYDLSRQMCNYMCNFIKTGDPNGKDADGTDMPLWEAYSRENPAEMRFTSQGAEPGKREKDDFIRFLIEHIAEREG